MGHVLLPNNLIELDHAKRDSRLVAYWGVVFHLYMLQGESPVSRGPIPCLEFYVAKL